MKVISTQLRDDEPISWEALEQFLQEDIYEEDFLVLSDPARPDYLQLAESEDEFVVEARLYSADGSQFQHLRTFVDFPKDATDIVYDFYHDVPIAYTGWEDVSDEF